jgi:hypothetical protein
MLSRIQASDATAEPADPQPEAVPQPERAASSAPASEQDQDIDEGDEFITRQVLEKDATFFGG